jgi:hypothetical protein
VGRSEHTHNRHRRFMLLGVLALAICMALGMMLGGSAQAKKKKHKAATVFRQSLTPNAAIPDQPASGPSTPVRSTITVGKKFKGKVVGDVNVTGIQTTGSGTNAADDLAMKLTDPNGRTVYLLGANNGIGDVSIGPLTIDADSPVAICDAGGATLCSDPAQTLRRPFAGTANQQSLGTAGTGGLPALDGVGMRGTWTFTIFDQGSIGQTSVLNGWGLQITAAKPVT